MSDPVNHPKHYTSHPSGVECITVVEHMPFNLGNAVKYIWRADEKGNDAEDLHKAKWYIEREIHRRAEMLKAENAAAQADIQAGGGLTFQGSKSVENLRRLNIDVCKRCGARVQPERKGDFFGFCTLACFEADKAEFKTTPDGVFGLRSPL